MNTEILENIRCEVSHDSEVSEYADTVKNIFSELLTEMTIEPLPKPTDIHEDTMKLARKLVVFYKPESIPNGKLSSYLEIVTSSAFIGYQITSISADVIETLKENIKKYALNPKAELEYFD